MKQDIHRMTTKPGFSGDYPMTLPAQSHQILKHLLVEFPALIAGVNLAGKRQH